MGKASYEVLINTYMTVCVQALHPNITFLFGQQFIQLSMPIHGD